MKGWKTLAFSLLLAVGGVLQTFDWATVVPQNKTWSGVVMVAIAGAIAALRVVTDTPVGMKVVTWLAIGLGALLLGYSPASAADMPPAPKPVLKAPYLATTPCTVTSCTGFFIGGHVANAGGNLDVVGTGLSGLATNGIMLGGQVGYEYWDGKLFAGIRGLGDFDVHQNASIVPGVHGLKEQFSYGVVGSLGYSLAAAFGGGSTGSQPQVTLPQQFMQSLMTPYINFGFMKRHGQDAIVSGAGAQALIATNWTLEADYFHLIYQPGTASSPSIPTTQTTENLFMVSINRHFGF